MRGASVDFMTHIVKRPFPRDVTVGLLELITSKLLAVPHGFATREGGVSTGAFASLNAGGAVGDDPASVEMNLDLLAAAARVERDRLFGVSQVHGDQVVEAPVAASVEADAIWSGREGDGVGIRTADCVPLLLVDPRGRRVAAVHAGWKGTLSEIAARTVEALARAGTSPADLRAAIGPAIGPCCYAVGEELVARFTERFPAEVCVRRPPGPFLDLPLAVRTTLIRAGVPASQIDALGLCTACDPRFFSHRRDKGRTGRHFSFVSCRFEAAQARGPAAAVRRGTTGL